MIEYKRVLNLQEEGKKKSIFLFGPRQTGKTSLLKKQFPEAPYYNLLRHDTFLKLSGNLGLIREELSAIPPIKNQPVIVDEIQKLPGLLDEIHDLIETQKLTFILTGSSPRKLKRGAANLLGGRARIRNLFPLTSREITDFSLLRAINYGTIPSIYLSDEPEEDLLSYCGVYLQEEIQAEGLTRRIENFSRFLRSAAAMNGKELNFEKVARDLMLPSRSVREYFYILSDTLVGRLIEPFNKTVRRKAVSKSKFYFFDVGVANILAGRYRIEENSELFGKAFEHLILNEIIAWSSYTRDRRDITFWRDGSGNEVDIIIGDSCAIEVKAAKVVHQNHLKGLRVLSDEIRLKHKLVVSMDSQPRVIGDIRIVPWNLFFEELWEGMY